MQELRLFSGWNEAATPLGHQIGYVHRHMYCVFSCQCERLEMDFLLDSSGEGEAEVSDTQVRHIVRGNLCSQQEI